mmetsp:Transcript_23090/g.60709  ORF Transcript_23090/g.60709 Transcript_23090/m.60709 type:complete len:253 (+) Transcript_23090:126-884(+)
MFDAPVTHADRLSTLHHGIGTTRLHQNNFAVRGVNSQQLLLHYVPKIWPPKLHVETRWSLFSPMRVETDHNTLTPSIQDFQELGRKHLKDVWTPCDPNEMQASQIERKSFARRVLDELSKCAQDSSDPNAASKEQKSNVIANHRGQVLTVDAIHVHPKRRTLPRSGNAHCLIPSLRVKWLAGTTQVEQSSRPSSLSHVLDTHFTHTIGGRRRHRKGMPLKIRDCGYPNPDNPACTCVTSVYRDQSHAAVRRT